MNALALFPHRNDFRDRLFPALQALTPAQLDWAPPGSRNAISFYLRHIAQSEDWFINTVIHQKPGFVPRRKAELPDIGTVFQYLRETRARTEALLEQYTVEQLAAEQRPLPGDGFRGHPRESETLLWIFHRIFWHEVYHGGQILLVMRLQGLEPPAI